MVLNGIDIDTTIEKEDIEQNDIISIDEYRNFMTDQKIKIYTGSGTDCLNIYGMIGEFNSSFINKLRVDLGEGFFNVLSFQGMSKDRNDIKGVFYNSTWPGVLKYYYGESRNTHQLGEVKRVRLFGGSPFDDHVILHKLSYLDSCRKLQIQSDSNIRSKCLSIQFLSFH